MTQHVRKTRHAHTFMSTHGRTGLVPASLCALRVPMGAEHRASIPGCVLGRWVGGVSGGWGEEL